MCHNIITKPTVHCISHSRPLDKALVLAVCYIQYHYTIIVHCYKPSGLCLPSRMQQIIKHRSYLKRPTVITHILSVLSSPVLFSFKNLSSRKRSLRKPALQIWIPTAKRSHKEVQRVTWRLWGHAVSYLTPTTCLLKQNNVTWFEK